MSDLITLLSSLKPIAFGSKEELDAYKKEELDAYKKIRDNIIKQGKRITYETFYAEIQGMQNNQKTVSISNDTLNRIYEFLKIADQIFEWYNEVNRIYMDVADREIDIKKQKKMLAGEREFLLAENRVPILARLFYNAFPSDFELAKKAFDLFMKDESTGSNLSIATIFGHQQPSSPLPQLFLNIESALKLASNKDYKEELSIVNQKVYEKILENKRKVEELSYLIDQQLVLIKKEVESQFEKRNVELYKKYFKFMREEIDPNKPYLAIKFEKFYKDTKALYKLEKELRLLIKQNKPYFNKKRIHEINESLKPYEELKEFLKNNPDASLAVDKYVALNEMEEMLKTETLSDATLADLSKKLEDYSEQIESKDEFYHAANYILHLETEDPLQHIFAEISSLPELRLLDSNKNELDKAGTEKILYAVADFMKTEDEEGNNPDINHRELFLKNLKNYLISQNIQLSNKSYDAIVNYLYILLKGNLTIDLYGWQMGIAQTWKDQTNEIIAGDELIPLTIKLLPKNSAQLKILLSKIELINIVLSYNPNEINYTCVSLQSTISDNIKTLEGDKTLLSSKEELEALKKLEKKLIPVIQHIHHPDFPHKTQPLLAVSLLKMHCDDYLTTLKATIASLARRDDINKLLMDYDKEGEQSKLYSFACNNIELFLILTQYSSVRDLRKTLDDKVYTLAEMTNEKPQPNHLYIQSTDKGLKYKVIGLDGEIETGTLSWDKLPGVPHEESKIIKNQGKFLPIILKQTANEGHTPNNDPAQKILRFQEKFTQYEKTLPKKEIEAPKTETSDNKFIRLVKAVFSRFFKKTPSRTQMLTPEEHFAKKTGTLFKKETQPVSQNQPSSYTREKKDSGKK